MLLELNPIAAPNIPGAMRVGRASRDHTGH